MVFLVSQSSKEIAKRRDVILKGEKQDVRTNEREATETVGRGLTFLYFPRLSTKF